MAANINFSGINSGLDTNSIIEALMNVERLGLNRLTAQRDLLLRRQTAYRDLDSRLAALRTAAKPLATLNQAVSHKAVAGNTALLSATASGNALPGTYDITILQKASASVLSGATDVGLGIDPDVALNDASAFGSAFKAGTFTVNGQQIAVAETDTLNDVLGQIETAMGGSGVFTAAYASGSDAVTLEFVDSGDGPLLLGSSADSSNLLNLMKLTSNGTSHTAASSSQLGRLNMTAKLNDGGANGARARTAIVDGGSGEFKINGVSIAFDSSADSMNDVIKRINDSAAGVKATYDGFQDRLVLTNKIDGALGIFAEDVSGNFVASMGLGGSTTLGQNASISIAGVNGGNPITSVDNLFTEAETGIAGLALNLTASSGNTQVTVSPDNEAMSDKIQAFVDTYNTLTAFIQAKSKITGTGSTAKVEALHGEQGVLALARNLRRTVAASVPGVTNGPSTLSGIGIGTTGTEATLTFDKDKFNQALTDNPEGVKSILADAQAGIMGKVVAFVDGQTLFGNGPVAERPDRMESSIATVRKSISAFERKMEMTEQRLRARFNAMEKAIGDLQGGLSGILSNLQNPSK
ncbi:MAG: flagellar filament capping protein FliD [Planctomycetes bacterium]|nr:flagellar filament capping protein FliD [Planctomycetota bacterium]